MSQQISPTSPIQITRDVFLIKKEDSWQKTAAKIVLWVSCACGIGLLVAIGTLFADLYRNVSSKSSLANKDVKPSTPITPPTDFPALLEEDPEAPGQTAAPASKEPIPAPASQSALPPAAEKPVEVAPQTIPVARRAEEPTGPTPAPKTSYWTTGKKIAAAVGTIALGAAAGYIAYRYGMNSNPGLTLLPPPTCPVDSSPTFSPAGIQTQCLSSEAPTQLMTVPQQLSPFSDFAAEMRSKNTLASLSQGNKLVHTRASSNLIQPVRLATEAPAIPAQPSKPLAISIQSSDEYCPSNQTVAVPTFNPSWQGQTASGKSTLSSDLMQSQEGSFIQKVMIATKELFYATSSLIGAGYEQGKQALLRATSEYTPHPASLQPLREKLGNKTGSPVIAFYGDTQQQGIVGNMAQAIHRNLENPTPATQTSHCNPREAFCQRGATFASHRYLLPASQPQEQSPSARLGENYELVLDRRYGNTRTIVVDRKKQ